MEDYEIIELIQSEDERGLVELQTKYGPFIEYVIRGVLSNYPEDMEECLGDVWMKLWTGLRCYDREKSALKTYISHVARNCAIDCVRKISRREKHIDKSTDFLYDNIEGIKTVKSAEEEVFENEKQKQKKKELLRAIEGLRDSEKELFIRKYYYLQSVAQIAGELNRSEKAIESKLSRIRKKLKASLKNID